MKEQKNKQPKGSNPALRLTAGSIDAALGLFLSSGGPWVPLNGY